MRDLVALAVAWMEVTVPSIDEFTDDDGRVVRLPSAERRGGPADMEGTFGEFVMRAFVAAHHPTWRCVLIHQGSSGRQGLDGLFEEEYLERGVTKWRFWIIEAKHQLDLRDARKNKDFKVQLGNPWISECVARLVEQGSLDAETTRRLVEAHKKRRVHTMAFLLGSDALRGNTHNQFGSMAEDFVVHRRGDDEAGEFIAHRVVALAAQLEDIDGAETLLGSLCADKVDREMEARRREMGSPVVIGG